ncbi:carbohydrate ABC transporter permease [Devriesea agamarum]|uniref:carbohydrate ABC transporter permease n=1 Tax=Devriesea agamarum TaxID=472569 RepID=UPI00071D6BBA|nr:carbohydrate ABC transporter permease [Devriesea agamarum]
MRSTRRNRIIANVILALVCLIFLLPIIWMIDLSLKSESEVAAFPTVWWPESLRWDNFASAFTYIDFLGYFRNSLIITAISTVLTVLSSSAVAFALATQRARGKKVIFAIIIGTMMIPSIITTIPVYILYARLGLTDTYVPWILMGIGGSAFLIFLIRQGFGSIPSEVEDAALIDGCGYFRIWWQIYLPMSKPILAAAIVLQFVFSWGDYLMPKLLLSNESTTLAVAISNGYVDQMQNPLQTMIAAGSLLFCIPVVLVFIVLQKYFVQGFATSGLK